MFAFVVVPFIVGIALLVVVFIVWTARVVAPHGRGGGTGDRRDTVLAVAMAPPPGAVSNVPAIEFEAGGSAFRYTVSGPARHGSTTLWIGVGLPSNDRSTGSAYRGASTPGVLPTLLDRLPELVCRLERSADRLGRKLGLNFEPKTGKKVFDDRYYVEVSDRSPAVGELLSLDVFEEAANAVSALGGAALVFNAEGHAIAIRLSRFGPLFEAAAFERALETIGALARALPPVRDPSLRKPGSPMLALFFTLALVTIPFALSMIVVANDSVVAPGFFSFVASVTGGVLALAIALLWMVSRGRRRGLRNFAIGLAVAIASMPGLTAAGIVLSNRLGDQTSAPVRVSVSSKRISQGDESDTCYLVLAPWDGQPDGATVRVSNALYERAAPGSEVDLDLGKGRLGFAWVRGVRLVP